MKKLQITYAAPNESIFIRYNELDTESNLGLNKHKSAKIADIPEFKEFTDHITSTYGIQEVNDFNLQFKELGLSEDRVLINVQELALPFSTMTVIGKGIMQRLLTSLEEKATPVELKGSAQK